MADVPAGTSCTEHLLSAFRALSERRLRWPVDSVSRVDDLLSAPLDWRPLAASDLPLLAEWLREPQVARWWNHESSAEAVERDFGPSVRGEEAGEDLVVSVGGRPIALVQRSLFRDYPDDLAEFAALVDVPDGAVELDYLIGDRALRGRGLGARMIGAAIEKTWTDHPSVPVVLVAVVAANVASWRALEKAGMQRVAEGPMEPENPIDDPLHYVYRIDRPAVTYDRYDHVKGPFYHGTQSALEVGTELGPGYGSNYQQGRVSNNIYFTALVETAAWGAELATALAGRRERGHVYVVEPLGPFEDDPNVTNKRFPGNPTQSYRTRHPLRVAAELESWPGHAPEVVKGMLDHLAQLREQGLDVIED